MLRAFSVPIAAVAVVVDANVLRWRRRIAIDAMYLLCKASKL